MPFSITFLSQRFLNFLVLKMKIDQIAAQLFTIKDHLKTPEAIAESLGKLSAMGYRAIQVSNIGPVDLEHFKDLCRQHGLVICSTHASAQQLRKEPELVVEILNTLGCDYTAFPFPAGVDYSDAASVNALIADLGKACQVLSQAGKVLTYHNHQFEFRRVAGGMLLDRIYDETPIHAELDTYWVQFGGGDPVAWCEKLKGRLPLIHLKDYRIGDDNQPVFAEIGNGNLNFKRIVKSAEASGCRWFMIEQDVCTGDPFESLRQSFDYVAEHLVD